MDANAEAPEPKGGGRTTWLVGAIVAIVLVIAAVAAIVIAGDREQATYAADSAEAAYQRYAEAWAAGDTDTAWNALTADAQSRLSRYEFREVNSWRDTESHRIFVDGRSGSDDRVVLALTIQTIYGSGILGTDRYEEPSRVTLVRVDGEWKIDTPLVGYQRW